MATFLDLTDTPNEIVNLGILVGTDSDTLEFLAAPTEAGQFLAYDGTELEWRTAVTSVRVVGYNGIEASDSPVTTSGDIEVGLEDTGVVAGTYVIPNISVDAQGRIVFIEEADVSQIVFGENVGTGTGLIYAGKTDKKLRFRSLKAGNNVDIVVGPNDITINSVGTVGATGPVGPTGATGPRGPTGPRGYNVWVNAEAPLDPQSGDFWYDTENGRMVMWYEDPNSSQWVMISGLGAEGRVVLTSATAPTNPVVGELWFNTNYGSLFVWYEDGNNGQWVEAYSGSQAATTMATLTDASSIAWNLNTQPVATVTLGGNRTLAAPSNMIAGGNYQLFVKQDGTGNRTLAYNAVFKWTDGVTPTLSTAANTVDVLEFTSDGTYMYGDIKKGY